MRLLTIQTTANVTTRSNARTQTQVCFFKSVAIFVRAPCSGGTGFQKNDLTGKSSATNITRKLRSPLRIKTGTHAIPPM